MTRWVLRAAFGFALGLGLTLLPEVAADDPKPEEKKSDGKSGTITTEKAKAPDWSAYTFVADVVGEVVKVTDGAVTIRVTWMVPTGSPNRRPPLSANHRHFHNPFMPARPSNVRLVPHHHDYELEFVPESLVRVKTLPTKTDENGKKVNYTEKEREELKTPAGVVGYAASKLDLTPGTIVEVYVIRDKNIPTAKATEDDLRVKYVVILGKDPNPPKDIASPPKTDTKKKN